MVMLTKENGNRIGKMGYGKISYSSGEKYVGLFQNGRKLEGKTSMPKFTTSEQYFALIIGNNDYQNLEKLDAAENDAKGIAKVLEKNYGFNNTFYLMLIMMKLQMQLLTSPKIEMKPIIF